MSEQKSPDVSIVIPTFNGGSTFKKCLRMLFEQDAKVCFEVIVIDSGSTDGTLDALKRYPVRLKQIDPKEFNHGLTRNTGVSLAQGQYVVLMTQDAIPADRNWLAKIITNFEDSLVAGVYCRQVPQADADVLTKRHLNRWLTARENRVINAIQCRNTYNNLDALSKLELCTFDHVCACVRKCVWQGIPYSNTYFAEDLEWGKKVIEAGYKIVYEPEASVIHSHNRSIRYEYRRTYLCHRRLFELFGLQLVPSFEHAIKFSMLNILRDTRYVLREERNWKRKTSMLLRVPFLSFSSVLAQYLGARDERLGNGLKGFKGV